MKIELTGSTGFVGQNISKYLKDRGVDCNSISLRDLNWNTTIRSNSDAIIHLAGKAHDTSNTSRPEEYFEINRDLTIKLFDFFVTSDIRDFFYFSSVKAIADEIDGPLYEDEIPNPHTPYGRSKLAAEQYLLKQNLPSNKRLFIIRPCMIHGPGNKGNLNLLYKVVKKGIPWPLAAYNNLRSFIFIDNLCFLIYKILLDNNLASNVFNFADDDPISTNELVRIIGDTLGLSTKLIALPKSLINTVVKFGDYLPLPLNSERLKKLTDSYVVSNEKVKSTLNVKELPIRAQDGLKLTIQSFNNVK